VRKHGIVPPFARTTADAKSGSAAEADSVSESEP